jgi:site-specific DNA recombinase
MKAAIYARKSTAQEGRADESKSVPMQIAEARAFISAKGWTLSEEHIFADDEISGAEFERRPGFMRLMSTTEPKAPFQTLVVRELARLGRESSQLGYEIKRLARGGVEIIEYLNGQSLTPKNWRDKALTGLQSAADEAHREQASIHSHNALTTHHRKGHVVGGRVFGYTNVDVIVGQDAHGRPLRSHVERVIDEKQAAVVRRIFELYGDHGFGLKAIAKQLTADGAEKPRPANRKDGLGPLNGWVPATVRDVLMRETYRGIVIWNKTKKKNIWGEWEPTDRPESEWLRTEAPHLRIITDDLWNRVHSRRLGKQATMLRFESGFLCGRPPKNGVRNLLAGLASCGVCGGGLIVETGGKKRGRYPEYVCGRHRSNLSCPNGLRLRVADINEAVLQEIEEHALTPEAIEAVIVVSEQDDVRVARRKLETERQDVERRIGRLVAAIELGSDAASLLAKLGELESRKEAINGEIARHSPIPRLAPDVIETRLAEWRRLLRASTTQGRTVIERVIDGRITFTPLVDELGIGQTGYTFEARTRYHKLFVGIATPMPRTGEDDRTGLDDIGETRLERDYGRLLENALSSGKNQGKGGGAPGGI